MCRRFVSEGLQFKISRVTSEDVAQRCELLGQIFLTSDCHSQLILHEVEMSSRKSRNVACG